VFERFLAPLIVQGAYADHFLKADFLTLKPSRFGVSGFNVVVGNPPYVSHHNMFKVQRLQASTMGYDDEFRLSGMASLWAYFVFHALRFLLPEGRMAWLLPGSLLHADYAKSLLRDLALRFERVAVISLEERLFLAEGVSETTEILLCDGLGLIGSGSVEVVGAQDVAACGALLECWNQRTWRAETLNGRAVPALVPGRYISTFRQIAQSKEVKRLGDVARIAIGIVTGDNQLFVINEETARRNNIPATSLKPILSKASIAHGMRLRAQDLAAARKAGIRCLLVDACQRHAAVRRYFDAVPQSARLSNVTFSKRADWRIPDDGKTPDAFIPYMHHTGPRLVLNTSRVNSTNTIHRVYFKPFVSRLQTKIIAISMLSTFSQISAESEGRSYGAGVLKHELSEAASIQILVPSHFEPDLVSSTFQKIDQLLRAGFLAEASAVSDGFLAAVLPELLSASILEELREALQMIRTRRQQVKTDHDGVAKQRETPVSAQISS